MTTQGNVLRIYLWIIAIAGLYSPPGCSGETQEVAVKIPRLEPAAVPSAAVHGSGGGVCGGSFSAAAAANNRLSLKDFYLEAQITANFDHENILSCLGVAAGRER